ncbi:MAG TPA: class I SAM-dependent methyltransferase [Pseudonocardia sp.]|nr:class I SAM-dependent methyltransferase [Pseudonocardia sp.]
MPRRARPVRFEHGYGQRLPYPDASFDRVLSAFMLHHLEGETRGQTLAEVRRVPRPGGALYLVDFGGDVVGPEGVLARRLGHSARLRHNLGDGVLADLREAGFTESTELAQRVGRLGPVTYYRAAI